MDSSIILVLLCALAVIGGCQARPEPMGGSFDGHRAGPMRGAASALVSGVSTEVAESEVGQVVPWVSPMLVAHMGPARGPAAKPVLLSPSQGRYYDTDSLEAYPQWRRQPEPVEEAEPSQRPAQPERYQRPVQPEQARPVQAHVHEARQHPEAKDEHRVQLMSTEPDSPPVITRQQAPRERPAAAPRTTSPEKQPAVQDSQPQRVVVKGSTNAAPNKKQQASVFSKATRYAVNKVLQSYRRPAHAKLTKRERAELTRVGATTKQAASLQSTSHKAKLSSKARMTAAPKMTKAGKLRISKGARKAAAAARHAARLN